MKKSKEQQINNYSISNIPLFTGCNSKFMDTINKNYNVHSYKKGKIIFIHGDKAQRIYYIRSGWIKLFRETPDGVQSITNMLTAGSMFGDMALFEDNTYPYSSEVIEDASLISFPLSYIKTEIKSNNTLATNMMNIVASNNQNQSKEIEHRLIQNASQRISCFILKLISHQQDKTSVNLPYDKAIIASHLGIQPETFSRALKKLGEDTGVTIDGSTIKLSNQHILENLTEYSCSSCSYTFPCKEINSIKYK